MAEQTVHQAFAEVMADVQAIRKSERNSVQNFNFRGIDSVVNAVGPALRDRGVFIVPSAADVTIERYQTSKGGQMQGVIVKVEYTVYGPAGDSFTGSAFGSAADSGDKAVPKAMSVAYRTFLLQSLTIPTDEPDPDSETHERAAHHMDPVREAKDDLAAAVKAAGMDIDLFARWAISAKGPGLGLRDSQDVPAIEKLTAEVKEKGADILDGFEPTGSGATTQ